ncbi:MAG: hypothetical protein WCG95_00260 [bacterium]
MQFKVDKITVEIIKPTKESSPKEDSKRVAAFVYKLMEMNFNKEQRIYKTL